MPGRVDIDRLSSDELFERGVAAARVGETGEAHTLLREVTAREPERADAWLWLASVETEPQAKRSHFERVLALRPDDADARAGLARLAEKYGQGVLRDEADSDSLHCTWHPDRETRLRCTRCSRPMCPECARQHPVGWRCKECAKELRSPLYKVTGPQVARAFLAGAAASVAGAVAVGVVSGLFFLLGFFVAAPAGTAIAEVVSAAGARKRGRPMQLAAVASVLAGTLLVWWLAGVGLVPRALPMSVVGLGLFAVVGGATAFARLR